MTHDPATTAWAQALAGTTCTTCAHDAHALPCAHTSIVRDGWWLARVSCRCGDEETP